MRTKKILQQCAAIAAAGTVWTLAIGAPRLGAQTKAKTEAGCCGAIKPGAAAKKAGAKKGARRKTAKRKSAKKSKK